MLTIDLSDCMTSKIFLILSSMLLISSDFVLSLCRSAGPMASWNCDSSSSKQFLSCLESIYALHALIYHATYLCPRLLSFKHFSLQLGNFTLQLQDIRFIFFSVCIFSRGIGWRVVCTVMTTRCCWRYFEFVISWWSCWWTMCWGLRWNS